MSFRYDDSLHIPMKGITSDLALWSDTYRCAWTDVSDRDSHDIVYISSFNEKEVPQTEAARYFTEFNESFLSPWKKNEDQSKIITFSHFLTSR